MRDGPVSEKPRPLRHWQGSFYPKHHRPSQVCIVLVLLGFLSFFSRATKAGALPPIAVLKVRGTSSRNHPKKSYHIELRSGTNNGKFAVFSGMPKESDWVLYAAYTDKSMIRDLLAQSLWRDLGHYGARCVYLELYLPTTNALEGSVFEVRCLGKDREHPLPRLVLTKASPGTNALILPDEINYQGIYVLMERIKRGKHRVNIERLYAEDDSEPEISGGYIFKRDSLKVGDRGLLSSRGVTFAYEEPKERDITPEQRDWLYNYIVKTENAIFGSDPDNPETGCARYIDVDSFIDYHWLVEVARNMDGYRLSMFLHKDRNGKLAMGPVWDWDMTFGNAFYPDGHKTNGWRWEGLQGSDYFWYGGLFQSSDFTQRYIDRWAELRTNILATSNVLAKVDSFAAEIRDAQVRNYQRWPTLGKSIYAGTFVGQTWEEEVAWLKHWIEGRLAWIDSQGFPAPKAVATTNSENNSIAISLSGEGGTIFYTLDGSDPRLSGGRISKKASAYKAPFRPPHESNVFARIRSDYNIWSPPLILPGRSR